MAPSVSVIIPMYNSYDTIVACVRSIEAQTYKTPIHIIVVNDGSTDSSIDVLKSAFSVMAENRSLTIIDKENGGVSSARNLGIRSSDSEWIALLDSDDTWRSDKLERQFSTIESNTHIQFLGANVNDEVYPYFGKAALPIFTLSARQLMIKWYPSTPTVLAKKSLLFKAGLFDENKRHGEDCDLWLRCMMHTDMYILNESVADIGHGKKPYGEKGLSADLTKMFIGEITNVVSALRRQQVGFWFSLGVGVWVFTKYLRRIILTKINFN